MPSANAESCQGIGRAKHEKRRLYRANAGFAGGWAGLGAQTLREVAQQMRGWRLARGGGFAALARLCQFDFFKSSFEQEQTERTEFYFCSFRSPLFQNSSVWVQSSLTFLTPNLP
jgi:hypothetical protein